MNSVEFVSEKLLDIFEELTGSPRTALLFILNEISNFRPDLLDRCSKIDLEFEKTFKSLYNK